MHNVAQPIDISNKLCYEGLCNEINHGHARTRSKSPVANMLGRFLKSSTIAEALRAASGYFPNESEHQRVALKVAELAERAGGMSDASISEELSKLSPEERSAWIEVAATVTDLQRQTPAARDQISGDRETPTPEELAAELRRTQIYVRRTRPQIARASWLVAATYGTGIGIVLPIVGLAWEPASKTPAFSETIFLALAAPAFTYMGVRAFDKWRSGGV